jgi:hypothetical protein
MFKNFLFFTIFFYLPFILKAQNGFCFINQSKKNVRVDFKLINNLIVIPIKINGKELVREEEIKTVTDGFNRQIDSNNSVSFLTSFSYKFKTSFVIKSVVKNSPAEKVGLLKEDIILNINGIQAHEFGLGKIIEKFQEKDGKK